VDQTRSVPVPAGLSADVIVVGAGPAGWAVAYHCADRGLSTALVAPRPRALWPATYGLWADQCHALPPGSTYTSASRVWAGRRRLGRGYAVLDNASVLAAFGRSEVRVLPDSVLSAAHGPHGTTLVLRSGRRVRCGVAVDASGRRRVLSGRLREPRVEQSAHGVIVPASVAEPLVMPGDAVFMRWADDHRHWPTFLYAVPLPENHVLLEETSLASRPGLPLATLRARLTHRMTAAGVPVDQAVGTERVRFALDVPLPVRRPGVVAFGVAGGLMHSATGYSVGDALLTAPLVADTVAAELPRGGDAAARAAHAVIWTPAARAVRRLRLWGLRMLLTLPPERVPEFFDAFFTLPDDLLRAYLSGRDDLAGTLAAMTATFRSAPWRTRARMATGWAVGPSGRRRPAAAQDTSEQS
jgi:lycopene beta-cyclase